MSPTELQTVDNLKDLFAEDLNNLLKPLTGYHPDTLAAQPPEVRRWLLRFSIASVPEPEAAERRRRRKRSGDLAEAVVAHRLELGDRQVCFIAPDRLLRSAGFDAANRDVTHPAARRIRFGPDLVVIDPVLPDYRDRIVRIEVKASETNVEAQSWAECCRLAADGDSVVLAMVSGPEVRLYRVPAINPERLLLLCPETGTTTWPGTELDDGSGKDFHKLDARQVHKRLLANGKIVTA